jgi:hypothetical protein
VWAAAPNDVWAVGGISVLRWNGSRWIEFPSEVESGLIQAIHGTDERDVWIVGIQGLLRHFDGLVWQNYDRQTTTAWLNDVWASALGDVWIVGSGGTIRHFNGTTWTIHRPGTVRNFERIHAYGKTAWASGFGLPMRWDGREWREHAVCRHPFRLWMLGEDDVLSVNWNAGVERRRGGRPGTRLPEGSGLDGARIINSLSAAELDRLCDYAAIQAGGYEAIHRCPTGGSVYAKRNSFECRMSYSGRGCTATVAQAEACARLTFRDPCSPPLEDPACKALLGCAP